MIMGDKIVFINQSSGYLMIDIINEFKDSFDKRVLIAGSVLPRETQLDADVSVKKIIPYSKRNVFYRLTTWLVSFFQIYFTIICKHRKAYLFFVSNPPLVIFLPLFLSNRYSILIYDIYPETLFRFGKVKENSLIVKLWRKANHVAYKKAENIFTISNSMAKILSNSADSHKVKVIPVWADSLKKPSFNNQDNPFLSKHKLENKFIVLYSGNIGLTHDIEPIVEVAKQCKQQDIFFLIIGNGEKENRIKRKIADYALTNCLWLPFQPAEMLPFTIGGSHVCVVATGRGGGDLSIPSKTFTLLAAAKPIMCIADPNSEMAEITKELKFGKSFQMEQVPEMTAFVEELFFSKEKYQYFSTNSLIASGKFTRKNAEVFKAAITNNT